MVVFGSDDVRCGLNVIATNSNLCQEYRLV